MNKPLNLTSNAETHSRDLSTLKRKEHRPQRNSNAQQIGSNTQMYSALHAEVAASIVEVRRLTFGSSSSR